MDLSIDLSASTEVLHALLVRVVQEEVALLDGPVNFEAQPQTCVLHQIGEDLLSNALQQNIQHCTVPLQPPKHVSIYFTVSQDDTEVPLKQPESRDLIPYVDVFPLEAGNRRNCALRSP